MKERVAGELDQLLMKQRAELHQPLAWKPLDILLQHSRLQPLLFLQTLPVDPVGGLKHGCRLNHHAEAVGLLEGFRRLGDWQKLPAITRLRLGPPLARGSRKNVVELRL